MGNGPSLRLMDLDLLKDDVVWGFNKCYLLYDQVNWRPNFYVTNDPRLTRHISSEIHELIHQADHTWFFFPSHFFQEKVLEPPKDTYWYLEKTWDEEEAHNNWSFTRDASNWVAASATVTIAGLQLAVYLGFNPIYLIGCDTSYKIPDTVLVEGSKENLVSTENDDPNHFSLSYSGKGDRWSLPDVELMIHQYSKSKEVLDEMGIDVFNATVGGNLEVFPRVSFESLF